MEAYFGSLILGGIVKHLVPGKKVNQWIPFINMAASAGYRAIQTGLQTGFDPHMTLAAAGQGVAEALSATGSHQSLKILTKLRVQDQAL